MTRLDTDGNKGILPSAVILRANEQPARSPAKYSNTFLTVAAFSGFMVFITVVPPAFRQITQTEDQAKLAKEEEEYQLRQRKVDEELKNNAADWERAHHRRQTAAPEPRHDDETAKYAARELVKQKLRDPSSAIFDGKYSWTDQETPVVISRTFGGKVRAVCGRVNAKNGFGGYIGERVYIVDLEGNFVTADGTVEDMQSRCLRP